MTYEKFIQPKEVEIGGRRFSTSQIPAIQSLKIFQDVTKYYIEYGLIGFTMFDVELTKQLLQYTAIYNAGEWRELDTETRINEVFEGRKGDLKRLCYLMVKDNFDFLIDGNLQSLLEVPMEVDRGSGS